MNDNKENTGYTGLEIAVIGMAGRFPGAKNISEFWENLKNGVESISFFTDRELEAEGIEPELLNNPDFVKAKGVMADIELFDADFFNFTPLEAEMMDPQLRIFHECSWEALEDAGYNPDNYDGLIGVYAGNAVNHYWVAKAIFDKKYSLYGGLKMNLLNIHFSTHVSYALNLKGPSLTTQTACSTSLVTIHTACMALLSGECHIALAGGISIMPPQKGGYWYQKGMISSPDGHCRAFDARAAGAVPGDGVGVVVLKMLQPAIDDRDYIYALVKGSAINNDGRRKVGYTAPSINGQAEVIKAALLTAGVEPGSISYIEAHGTGTELGDPVEIEALRMVFQKNQEKSIPIGSVKTNVGHLNSAAGVTGFIKTVLALKYQLIPPSLHFETPNPKLDIDHSPFFVNTILRPWENKKYPRRAGVSSFGLGGTNAHVVLEEYSVASGGQEPFCKKVRRFGLPKTFNYLILLSARTPAALEKHTRNMVTYFEKNPGVNLDDVVYTLQKRRKAFQHRKMIVCSTTQEAIEVLATPNKKVKTYFARQDRPPVIFMFSGQGAQYPNMGLDLYEKIPAFRAEMDHCFKILNRPEKEHRSYQSYGTYIPNDQAAVFIFGYALAKMLLKWGITPRAMIGYSLGEYIAACIAGVFSLEDALKLIVTRGKLMNQTPVGAMLSVPLLETELEPLLSAYPGLSLAIVNGPTCIVSGTDEAINHFENDMKQKRLLCIRINISQAAHSNLMQEIKEQLIAEISKITLKKPVIPYISNVTGDWITVEQATNPRYWGEQLCAAVRFSNGIQELLKEKNSLFVEVGPGRMLGTIVRQHPDKNDSHQIMNLVKHPQEKAADDYFLLNKIGQLWLYGVNIDWNQYYADHAEKRNHVPLPTYPFERRRYWIEADPHRITGQNSTPPGDSPKTPLPVHTAQPNPVEIKDIDYEYRAPRDEVEETITIAWQELLGFERIGIDDNFFELNGDSVTATQVISRLQQLYPIEISLQSFFEEPTVAHLAGIIKELLLEKVKNMTDEEVMKGV
ncbi:MAG: acyltransferase domain-containing protein [Acidobacteria bacterium]|nr:acyltransferase domain-containing protein [Acidobacteriota bacterium]